jgi:RNA polymerase sigma factor (sigma-70 family)
MGPDDRLAVEFERQRRRLRGLAYRMLGSVSDADDAVQDAWLRLSRTESRAEVEIDNLGGWLTTVVARVSLNQLRARATRREDSLAVYMPDPVVGPAGPLDPEEAAVVVDSVSLALLVVLDTLTPAERLAFVLHDVFAVPFEQIAPLVDRTPAATRQLASRARRRVQASAPTPDGPAAQREVVNAFFTAAQTGNFERLIAVCTRTWSCALTWDRLPRGCPPWCEGRPRWLPGLRCLRAMTSESCPPG